jgi:hypothetical protein
MQEGVEGVFRSVEMEKLAKATKVFSAEALAKGLESVKFSR